MNTSANTLIVSGKLFDIHKKNIYPAEVQISNGRIEDIQPVENAPDHIIMPGLIDSHVHIESSMVTPGAFATAAVIHGTTAAVSDPHEIANVLGVSGVRFMIEDGERVPFKFYFGAPSCVPATVFESNGATIDHVEIEKLLRLPEIKYLSEMMNYPGVIYGDKEVLLKIDVARKLNKPIDGHAPGLSGDLLRKYVSAGISTDHECSTIDEAKEKIALGMKILIREGSAARNMKALRDLFLTDPEMIMLCSDDLHPEMLRDGHINKLIASLLSDGYNAFDVIRSATINPVIHYGLESGLLRIGDPADFIVVDSLNSMSVKETWIDGEKVYSDGAVHFKYTAGEPINKFNCSYLKEEEICVRNEGKKYRVIDAMEGELTTGEMIVSSKNTVFLDADKEQDILKIIVKDRYADSAPAVGFIHGFGLKSGAFASSVAHDSHNIICVGTNDKDITDAVNQVVSLKGGLAFASGGSVNYLKLDIGGIMTTEPCDTVANKYQFLSELVRRNGSRLKAPFMTLSFMALLVIPELKIGDRGLFDVKKFQPVKLFLND
jgi:adenine deaminase